MDAFAEGVNNSHVCLTIAKENPIGMFGVAPECVLGHKAVIWFLGTNELLDIQKPFLRYSKTFIDMFLQRYKFLYNFVDTRNTVSLKWLRFCGANFMPPVPYGKDGEYFQFFWFSRDKE